MKLLRLLPLLLLAACVQLDPETNKALPRGDQRYRFEEVRERAGELEVGQSMAQVLILLGSPAERSEDGRTWIYLPERTAFVVPARALKLTFDQGRLADFAYHAIVLGQRL